MKLSLTRKRDKINLTIKCPGGTEMAICYDRLFHLMMDKRMSNDRLKEKIYYPLKEEKKGNGK